MRFGLIIFVLLIAEIFLFIFGYISSNSLIGVVFGSGEWQDLFRLTTEEGTGLLSSGNLIGAAGTAFGLILKNNYLIFAGFIILSFGFILGINGIIPYFPEPMGEIIYGLFSFLFAWMALEWWRMRDY